MQGWSVVLAALAYVTLLFLVASLGDRRRVAAKSAGGRPLTYAFSLAIYCTSWTFFGSVGLASERTLEFLAIYIGPVLVFVFGYPLLRRIIRIAKSEKITSIADFLAARYGKSFAVASLATLIATLGTIPYIALQLKAISETVSLMVEHYNTRPPDVQFFVGDISLTIAMLLAVFAVLFGTRHADATEHQNGLILAVAVESIVKLASFVAVGVAVTFFLFGGVGPIVEAIGNNQRVQEAVGYNTSLPTWIVTTLLSAFAIVMLPRQFHVTVVENRTDAELRTATRVFPLYLIAINIFVLPIAFAGLTFVGSSTSADLYVLALPLIAGHDGLAMLAFIGGLSAATAMVIVASVALSVMISNDLIIPLFVRRLVQPDRRGVEDWSRLILNVRRASIFIVLLAAFFYYRETTNNTRLASIGLISFAAVAQFAPSFLGGLIWRRANGRGAVLGMLTGIIFWAYTLLLPSLAPADTAILTRGLFGMEALRPQSLFGTVGEPLNHGVLWSLAINTLFFVLGSLSRSAMPLERIQAAIFVPRDINPMPSLRRFRTTVTVDELKDTIARYLGVERTERSFQSFATAGNEPLPGGNEPASMTVVRFSEQLLASAVGSSSSRLILSLLFQRNDRSQKDALRLLDDASEALQHNRDLLQTALDQMDQGITVFDTDLRLTNWNRQFRSLFDLPDSLGQVGVSLHHILRHLADRGDIPADLELTALNRLSSFGTPWRIELKTSGRIIELRSNPMPDGGTVATYSDVTAAVAADLALKRVNETLEQRVASRTAELTRVNQELALAQEVAEEANLSKTRFLAGAGHDILQPLNAARLYCSSLIERAEENDLRQAATNIESSLESVETILGAVLDISRLDAGAQKPNETTFRLDALLKQIQTDFSPMAAEKRLQLRILPSTLAVHTDRNMLRRVIQNLVSNAIKYTRSGRILIGVRRRGKLLEIQVLDSGIGIASNDLNSVFQEFLRLDEGAREAQGLGLGLSIVDRIARVLRLEIQIESHKGRGTRFSVILPRAEPPSLAADQAALSAPVPGAADVSGLKILCIDNDPQILDAMKRLLEGWGCDVSIALNSQDALAFEVVPDMMLVDYHLDNETGLDAVTAMRARHKLFIPAVLVTADRGAEARSGATALDMTVINKPVKPAVLRMTLGRLKRMEEAAE
ncbi:PAS-domain containing protein [Tianweitania populi]|uniref:histidine kinase n=1 Tax=Tianweitania populi TaxID=1607949 RepID=A0A8J3GJW9_9HYPH|nr:PAS domain-containing hybrid sensor histidine kinase/response regulator [Tianweitania populi]GHD14621.1 histidine kinase [Tianweitania populi]